MHKLTSFSWGKKGLSTIFKLDLLSCLHFDECLPNSIQTRYVLTYTSYFLPLVWNTETLNCNIAPYFNYFFHRDYHNFKINNLYKFLLQSLVWIVFRFRHYTLSDFRYYVFTSCIWAFLNLLTYEYVRYIRVSSNLKHLF